MAADCMVVATILEQFNAEKPQSTCINICCDGVYYAENMLEDSKTTRGVCRTMGQSCGSPLRKETYPVSEDESIHFVGNIGSA